jgi:hypothetical protein
MKPEDKYLKFVRWSEEDRAYVGYCPDLFPWGGVCHAETEEAAFDLLCGVGREEIDDLKAGGSALPEPQTRPMREAVTS